ncbi:MAG: lysophospholipid acyltransferase family protein [Pyrinomonadaceae bacterium]
MTSGRRQGRWRSPLYWAGRLWLGVFGWKVEGDVTAFKKYVVVAAPHTSNWDFPFMMAAAHVLGVRASWLGKHTIFAPPWGWFFRGLGGIPVDRRAPQTMVAQLAERFKAGDELILALAPEGTRGKVPVWKSGFYHIAAESRVPIALGFLDYERKLCGLGPYVKPTGNVRADMDEIRAFYQNIRAKHPEHASEPRLREETQPA